MKLVAIADGLHRECLIAVNGGHVSDDGDGLLVSGLSADRIGDLAAESSIPLHQLRTDVPSLEDVFLALTDDNEAIR